MTTLVAPPRTEVTPRVITHTLPASWSGAGIVLTAKVAWIIFKQRLDAAAIDGVALIVAGLIAINVFSNSTPH